MIKVEDIVEALKLAVTNLPEDVVLALKNAYEREEHEIAKYNLEIMLRAVETSKKKKVPLCQDTGTPIFFVETDGTWNVREIYKTIFEAVKRATDEIPLRPNAISLLTGKAIGNIPEIHVELGERNRISILIKGGGSENCSALYPLTPGDWFEGVKEKIISHISSCGGKPCPPIIIGIGIASPAEKAMILAKKSLLRKIGERHEKLGWLEEEILEKVNSLSIGPMGLGGKTTALDVKIEVGERHPASFIVGIAIQCWAHRRAFIEEKEDGEVMIWQ
ncbi:MAG: fumarate hydratase subunit alpha [Pyrococcus sp.]|uniref:fumarate hydratase n=1 Tax=Pyrococcus sp. TaxID=33866 RepID=UPI002587423A|nr:fumarate hydratase [Pyrococcus sp.]MDK2868936.1 fumarate hydratase subunit alpha [Pyrococcus sp.]